LATIEVTHKSITYTQDSRLPAFKMQTYLGSENNIASSLLRSNTHRWLMLSPTPQVYIDSTLSFTTTSITALLDDVLAS
jgi:hypothetical protein